MKRKIGLIVNPIAGMGGSVGLKGTDGEMYKRAVELGAKPVTPKRTKDVLSHIRNSERITLYVAPGKMGEQHIRRNDMPFTVIGTVAGDTSKEDTKRISEEMVNNGIELLVFVGGDGTARDIYDAINSKISVFSTVQAAKQFATKLISIRLSPSGFDLHPDLLLDQLNEPCLVILDNPNNPTGKILLDRKMVGSVVDHREVLMVVDEACYEFSGVTFADMVQEHPNLAITRTMDKAFSLAGARIGYMITVAVQVYKSMTNFLLLKTDIPDIVGKLADIGILISDLSNQLSSSFIRVSIGNREENDAFLTGYMKIRETFSQEKF